MLFKSSPSSSVMPMEPQPEPIDTTKRYDVYCSQGTGEACVYRNVLFKGLKHLFAIAPLHIMDHFLELEDPTGQTVYVAPFSIQKFHEHGVDLEAE